VQALYVLGTDRGFGRRKRFLYAVRADDTWRAQITDLWTTTNDASGPTEAWTVVLTAMMEDPLFLTY